MKKTFLFIFAISSLSLLAQETAEKLVLNGYIIYGNPGNPCSVGTPDCLPQSKLFTIESTDPKNAKNVFTSFCNKSLKKFTSAVKCPCVLSSGDKTGQIVTVVFKNADLFETDIIPNTGGYTKEIYIDSCTK